MRNHSSRSTRGALTLACAAGLALTASAIAFAAPNAIWTTRGVVQRIPLPQFTRIDLPAPVIAESEATTGEPEDQQDASLPDDAAGNLVAVAAAPGEPASAGSREDTGVRARSLLNVSFDLSEPGRGDARVSGKTITVRKRVRVGDEEIGNLPIHVDGNSRLLVDRKALAALLDANGVQGGWEPGSDQGLVSFGELRSQGLDLRYDPNSDAVVIAAS